MNFRILLFLLLLSASLSGFSQEPKKWKYSYTNRYWGVRDGLAQTQVFESFQDSYGYLWFSTNDGVSRFDGLRFDNFSRDELHINSKVKYFNQYGPAVYMITRNAIVFVYPDRTKAYYPLPDNYRVRDADVVLDEDCIYLFNCYSHIISYTNNVYKLIRFDLKTKTFTVGEEDVPFTQACVFGKKIYAVSPYKIKNH